MPDPAGGGSRAIDRQFELSVLGMLISGYLAVLGSGFLDVVTAAVAALALLARVALAAGLVEFRVPPVWTTVAAVAYVIFYPLDYLYLSRDFLTATSHLVFFLVVVRVITATGARHFHALAAIAVLELLLGSLVSSNLTFFVGLAMFLPCSVAALMCAELRRSLRRGRVVVARGAALPMRRGLLRLAAGSSLAILVLSSCLFFILPRTARAALQRLSGITYRLPGFSNEVTLGEIGQIQQSSDTVMRVQFFNSVDPPDLKWRGEALGRFDGKRWFNPAESREILRVVEGQVRLNERPPGSVTGLRIGYEVRTQRTGTEALFFPGIPDLVRIDLPIVARLASGSYEVAYGTSDGLRYSAYSILPDGASPEAAALPPPEGFRDYLELPANRDRRTAQLARSVAGAYADAESQTRAIELYLRANYGYTLELPAETAPDPVAHFLFTRREGHCEYFASAMAVMLREIGIPSRLATGFQSGEWNPLSGWRVIRTSDAHSWVEAWLPGKGWTTFDPTPVRLAPGASGLLDRWRLYRDAAETFWQEWILDYNLERQFFLVARVGSGGVFREPWMEQLRERAGTASAEAMEWLGEHWLWLALALAGSVAILLLGRRRIPGWWRRWALRARREQPALEVTRQYLEMLALLDRRGLAKPPWMTPAEFARGLPFSGTGNLVREITAAYNQSRFGRRPPAPHLEPLLEQLRNTRDPAH